MAQRQRPAVHRLRDSRFRRFPGPTGADDPGVLTREQWDGGGLRQDAAARLRVPEPARNRGIGHAATARLARGLQRSPSTQGLEDAVTKGVQKKQLNGTPNRVWGVRRIGLNIIGDKKLCIETIFLDAP